jgi:hypothetical protein
MKTRKSILSLLVAATFVAPVAAFAADFSIQDNAARSAPFGAATYERVNGGWVRVDADKNHNVPKPDVMGAGFTQQNS